MGKYVSLSLLKKNVIAEDFDDDDELLDFLLLSAEADIIGMTQREESDLLCSDGTLPFALQQAVVLLASFRYQNRSGGNPSDGSALYNQLWSIVNRYREPKNDFSN